VASVVYLVGTCTEKEQQMKTHGRPWVLAEKKVENGLSMLRLLQLEPEFPFNRFQERLNVIWSFRETGVDDTPSQDESDAMEQFENRICNYIETSDLAVLCMVFTEPGYREYVFYSRDVESFLEGLTEISEEPEPYPIEIHHEADRDGTLYRSYAQRMFKKS
jgi:Family of unknown function (DUF695)